MPRDLRRGRRRARRVVEPDLLRRARRSLDADREYAARDSRGQHRRLPVAGVSRPDARLCRRSQSRRVLGQRRGRHLRVRRRAAHRSASRPVHAGGGAGGDRRHGRDSRS